LLRQRNSPFIVTLNKIDRIFDWKPNSWSSFNSTFNAQKDHCKREFEERVSRTIAAFQEQGLNCCLYFKNNDFRKNISLVPTSAITGEGLPDLLMLLTQLTQNMMSERLQYITELECTVLEVKVVDGIGTTIDVILSNGVLHRNDTIVVCGLNGPIVTSIRALLTPHPLSELRVKGEYKRVDEVKAAAGIKIAASNLEDAVAGSQLLVCGPNDDIEDLKDEVMSDLASILSKVDRSGRGVCVQASTLGSLEALLQFLSDMKIPVSGISIGPVYKKDVIRAAVMLEHQRELAVILAFDVKVSPEAKQYALDHGVRIFSADIIYHLFDQFTAYVKEEEDRKRSESANVVVFPCILTILPNCVFRQKEPIVLGVRVEQGILRKGTPLAVPDRAVRLTDVEPV
jgi:translation initiation factor 5B